MSIATLPLIKIYKEIVLFVLLRQLHYVCSQIVQHTSIVKMEVDVMKPEVIIRVLARLAGKGRTVS